MASELTLERVRRDVDVLSRAGLDAATFVAEIDESLHRAIPFAAACYATLDPASSLLTGTYKSRGLAEQDSKDHEWGMVEYTSPEPSSFVELARVGRPSVGMHLETGGDLERSTRMREFIRPEFDYADELRVVGLVNGRPWGAVAIFADHGHFTEADVDFVGSLSGAIGLAMRAGILARLPEATPPLPTGPAVVVVDGNDEITMMSVGAAERLAEVQHRGSDGPEGTLYALVAAARRYAAGGVDELPRCRVRLRTGQWFVLHSSPLATADGTTGNVVVTIEEARPPEIVPLVVEAFGLTGREREVTQLVLQGVDTKEIAATLCVSAYTVQDHLKAIFEKAGVRSRRELTARVFFDQYLPRIGGEVGAGGWFAGR